MCQLNHKNGLADTNTLKTSYELFFLFFIFLMIIQSAPLKVGYRHRAFLEDVIEALM